VWWRDIPGYDGWYQINEYGEIRSWRVKGHHDERSKKPTLLRPFNKNGTYRVILTDTNGISRCKSVMRCMREVGYSTPNRIVRRAVDKLDENGNVVEHYPSIRAAGEANYISGSSIDYYCKGRNTNLFCGKYTFRYASPKTKSGRKK
jgi:hypothetical protein